MSATIKHIDIKGVQIPVIFEEQKSLPILNLQLVFQNSGYIQDNNKSGLANLSSKLLNEGTKELGATKFAKILDEKEIYCGLDVVTKEPIEQNNPLLSVKNKQRLLLTPHIAWASIEARKRLIEKVAKNIEDFLK